MLLNTTGTIRALDRANIARQIERLEEATADLVANGADVVILGGSPLFTQLGPGSDRDARDRLSAKFGIPVVPGITCEVEALRHLGVARVAVATPYPAELDEDLVRFLEAARLTVVSVRGARVSRNADIGAMSARDVHGFARETLAGAPDADGLLVACARWPTLEVVPALEREFGRPVVASVQADIWYALTLLGIHERVRASSRLLDSLSAEPVVTS